MKPKVDSREPPEITEPFVRAGWDKTALPCGDFQFEGVGEAVILVERKTISQYLTDMHSGQLVRQVVRLKEAADFPWLLLEGPINRYADDTIDGRATWEQVFNQLATLQEMGLMWERTASLAHTTTRVFQLEERYRVKEYHPSAERHPSGDERVGVLCRIYGVGPASAQVILGLYPTLLEVANASVPQLMECPGVGPKLARRVYEYFRAGGKEG